MSGLANRLVTAAAENMLRRYASEYTADHLSPGDFASEASEDVASVLRLLAEDAERFTAPKALVYHGEATGRLVMYVDDLPVLVSAWLRSVAEVIEKGEQV